jgi:hypothetical protein
MGNSDFPCQCNSAGGGCTASEDDKCCCKCECNCEDDGNGDNEKVTVCHNGNEIEIALESLPAHLNHGDTLGPCPEEIVQGLMGDIIN